MGEARASPQRAPVGGDRRGGAGRDQWTVRGALRPAAPGACPRCTVSVKLQQLAGHRNLITQPCPFPTSPPVPGRLLLGEDAEQRQPLAKWERDGEDAARFRRSGILLLFFSPLPGRLDPPSPLLETAILAS